MAAEGAPLRVSTLGCVVEVATADALAAQWLQANFGGMRAAPAAQPADLLYRVSTPPHLASPQGAAPLLLHAPGQPPVPCSDGSELLFQLEQHLVVALQLARPQWLFLHAAALEFNGRACLLVGESGAGKSTTAWALLNRGWGYLSDELAPLDPATWEVQPYPHALCMKRVPPAGGGPWPPPGLMDLGDTLHVPVASPVRAPCPLLAIVFVQHAQAPQDTEPPSMRRISAGEAAARLYVQALNPLAHPERGLDVVRRAAQQVPCFQLRTSALRASAELLEGTLAPLGHGATTRGSPTGSPGPLQTAWPQSPAPSSA